ncbi:LuxR family transcriptional regulator [soil metagenome]
MGLDHVFVGRSGELQSLRANLGWAGAGEPRVVVVEGPPGIGKSALVRAFLAQAGPDVRSLSGGGAQAESGVPFGVLKQLLLGADLPAPALAADTDPLTAGALLVDVLGTLQDTGPVVVAVDDGQWVDAPSMRALTFALRRLRTDRVLALVARDDGRPDLPDGVHQLVEARGEYLRLGGLDAVALAELAVRKGAGRLPVAAVERFRHHTGGSPLHATALLEQLDPVVLRRAEPLPPSSYATVVISRLGACSPATRALVSAAAVLGNRCSLPTAARLAGLDDPSVALDEALAVRLLEGDELPDDRSVGFDHPLTRAAVYGDLEPGRRHALHARAATVIAGKAALDHRVAATPVEDADLARELAGLADAESSTHLWVLAAGHFEAAAHLDADSSHRDRFLLDAAHNYLRGGEQGKAAELVKEVSADSSRRRSLLGHLALVSGRLEEAGRLLEEAWQGDADLGAPLATLLAWLALGQARAEDAVTWGHRAMASAGDDAAARSAARSVVTLGLALGGRGEEAMTLLDDVPVAASDATAAHADGMLVRGVLRCLIEDLDAAVVDLAAVSSAGAGGRMMQFRVYALACLAWTEYLLGNWDDSVGHADLAVSLAEDGDHAWALAFCRSVATMALAARGEWERAVVHAEAAASAAARSKAALDFAWAASAAAQVAFARTDPVGIVAAVEPAIDLWSRDGIREPTLLPWREQYADALVSLGRLDEAAAIVADLTAAATALGRCSSLAGATRVGGRLEAARGNIEVAESAFEDALEHLEGIPTPFSRALVEEVHGRHLRRMGQPRAAAAHLRTARATFADLGARPFLERCDRELAACGLVPDPRTQMSPVSLTPQELATARLVASGRSIREVAVELVISGRTAEQHLRHVYAELGISSRHRLAAALAGRNLG